MKNVLIILMLVVIFSACGFSKHAGERTSEQSYIDANLYFSISYPEAWAPYLVSENRNAYAPYSSRWNIRDETALVVISIPRHEIVPGIQPEGILTDLYPNLVLNGQEVVELPAGKARKASGYTPRETIWSWIFENPNRLYIIICTAKPELFNTLTRQFEEVARSFEILD